MKAQPSPLVIAATASRLLQAARPCQTEGNGTKGQNQKSNASRTGGAATRCVPAQALGAASAPPT